MHHRIFGRKLHRNTKVRKQLFHSLAVSFIKNGKLTTSLAKAKAVRPYIERLVNKAKKQKGDIKNVLLPKLRNTHMVDKLINIAKQMADRQGGFTRLLKVRSAKGNYSQEALLIWSENISDEIKPVIKETKEDTSIKRKEQTKT